MNLRHPPGRAGRLWLLDRLAVAERAAAILDRKQHALLHDRERLTTLTEQTTTTWTAVVRDAETWQRRAMILGARPDLQAAATQIPLAQARIVWRTEMGVEVPSEASFEPAPTPSLSGTPALAAAATVYRRALQAAVEHAAATTALRRVEASSRSPDGGCAPSATAGYPDSKRRCATSSCTSTSTNSKSSPAPVSTTGRAPRVTPLASGGS